MNIPVKSEKSVDSSNIISNDSNVDFGFPHDQHRNTPEEAIDNWLIDTNSPITLNRFDSREITCAARRKRVKVIENYLIGSVLGEGSYGKVKEALDITTLSRRAIKILKRKRLKKIPNGENNVEREVSLLKKLQHKNIVEFIKFMHNPEKQKLYLVFEYCTSVLQEVLDHAPEKKLPIWQAHGYFCQLLEGLEYLHGHGVIHNDIKPGNLLLASCGTLKISDFGIAQVLDRYSADDICRSTQGSPAFQSPEIADGALSVSGFKVDIWSSGVTLFNMTTGKYPFEGDNIYSLYENIAECQVKVPVELEESLKKLLYGMLEKDPGERLTLRQIQIHNWVKTKPPVLSKCVSIPEEINKDTCCSSTIYPYLNMLHNEKDDDSDDEDDEELFYMVYPRSSLCTVENKPSNVNEELSDDGDERPTGCLNLSAFNFCKKL